MRLGRLRDHTVTRAVRKIGEVPGILDHHGTRKIPHQSIHFDVATLPDHHGEKTERDEQPQLVMGMTHERASAIRHSEAGGAPRSPRAFRGTMSGDHDLGGRRAVELSKMTLPHSVCGQPIPHDRIVDQFAEDGERPFLSQTFRLSDGVSDAEAKAVVFCDVYFHNWMRLVTLRHKVHGQNFAERSW